jgi:DNA polymerase-3 subunit beta
VNLTIPRNELRAALARVKPAVQRNALPALAGVLIEADGTTVRFTASNIDTFITTTVTAVGEAGRVLVHHDPLERLAGNTNADVTLSLVDDDLHVTAGRAKARLRLLDADTFPRRPVIDGGGEAKLDEDWRAIQQVTPFRSTEPTRPILTGVHLANGLVTTTDSYRLARHSIGTDADLLLDPSAIVAASRVCPDGPVTLRWQGARYEIEADGTVWSGNCIAGDFPPVASLIPTDPALAVTVDRAELLAAIRTVASIGDDTHTASDGRVARTNVVRFTQSETAGELVLQRRTQDVGDAEVTLPCEAKGDCTYGFAAGLLVPLLGALSDDTVTLQGTTALKPWIMREGEFLGLIMPVRVS